MPREQILKILPHTFQKRLKGFTRWIIVWIGKAHAEQDLKGNYEVVVWFYPYAEFVAMGSKRRKFREAFFRAVRVDCEVLDEFVVGCVYNNRGQIIEQPVDSELFDQNRETIIFESSTPEIELSNIIDIKSGWNYPANINLVKGTPCVFVEWNNKKFIIPSAEIARYFFFLTSLLIKIIFRIDASKPEKRHRIIKGPYTEKYTSKRMVDVEFDRRYIPNEQRVFTKIMLSESYRKAANAISSSARCSNEVKKDDKNDKSNYYRTGIPVCKELHIRVLYYPIIVGDVVYNLVNQIVDHKDNYSFDEINPFYPVKYVPPSDVEGTNNNVRESVVTIDECQLVLNIDNASGPSGNSNYKILIGKINGEKHFPDSEPAINSANYLENTSTLEGKKIKINNRSIDTLSTNERGSSVPGIGRGGLSRRDKNSTKEGAPFYELFLLAMDRMKREKCFVTYAKYSNNMLLFQDIPTKIKDGETIHFLARLEHPNFNGVHYLVESGEEDKPNNHMTPMISRLFEDAAGEIDFVHKIMSVTKENGALWGKVKKSRIFSGDGVFQKNFDHQKDKRSIQDYDEVDHFIRKIEKYLHLQFSQLDSI